MFYVDAAFVTISNSSFIYNNATADGGVFNLKTTSSLNISSSTFQFNTADRGGAIYGSNSNILVHSSSFTSNSALHDGGAIYTEISSSVQLHSSIFSSNSGDDGAALLVRGNIPSLTSNCTFKFNIGPTIIFVESSSIRVFNSKFLNNSGTDCQFTRGSSMVSDSSFHGGISPYYGAIALYEVQNFISSNLIFYGNQAKKYGGAFYSFKSSSKWTNITVDKCRGPYGAIYIGDSTSEIDNSRISNNYQGGLVVVDYSVLLVTHSAIINNSYMSPNGGGIFASSGANITMKEVNCSLNTAKDYGGCIYLTGMNSSFASHNCNIGSYSAPDGGGIHIRTYVTGILICHNCYYKILFILTKYCNYLRNSN